MSGYFDRASCLYVPCVWSMCVAFKWVRIAVAVDRICAIRNPIGISRCGGRTTCCSCVLAYDLLPDHMHVPRGRLKRQYQAYALRMYEPQYIAVNKHTSHTPERQRRQEAWFGLWVHLIRLVLYMVTAELSVSLCCFSYTIRVVFCGTSLSWPRTCGVRKTVLSVFGYFMYSAFVSFLYNSAYHQFGFVYLR